MIILIFIIGLISGVVLNIVIDSISFSIVKDKEGTINILVPVVCIVSYEILFFRLGISIILVKAMVMTAILIIISFIDLRHRIIPDFMVSLALAAGIIFSFISGASFLDTIMGMIVGGGVMFLLALVPSTLGGGDIKLMFAMGAFLGVNKTLWALIIAFIAASVISIALIFLKIKGTKDYIPFGPFLAFGSFISLVLFM